MPTTVVGFRLGSDQLGRQVTVVLTAAGVLHRCHGLLGAAPKASKPEVPTSVDPQPVPRQAGKLRKIHAELTDRGYHRILVSPACVRLDTTEHPLHPHPYGVDAPPLHPELLDEFVGLAPSGPRTLDEAVRDFYTAIGIPPRPRHPVPSPQAPARLSPRAEDAVRALARGSELASSPRRAVGWRVTANAVRLHVGPRGEDLAHREVAELQLALAAWLRLNPAPGSPAAAPPADGRRQATDTTTSG